MKKRMGLIMATALVFSLVAPLIASAQLADTPWPLFRHDLNHTGRSPYIGSPVGVELWNFTTNNFIFSSPAIGADGTIYVGSYDNKLYAIGPEAINVHNINKDTWYDRIQDAIDDARDGDTIKVNPGVYNENLIVHKELTILGDPVIDGCAGVGIWVQRNNTHIENMTVMNSSMGIFVYNASFTIQNVTLFNNTIYDCTNNGIEFWNVTESVINGSAVYDNIPFGVYLLSSTFNNISANDIHNNSQNGIYFYEASNNRIAVNTVYENKGNGIKLEHLCMNNTIWRNDVYNNTNDGIYFALGCDHNTIAANTVWNNNNGVALSQAAPNNYNDIIDNTVHTNIKYGIYLKESERYNNITRNNVSENEIGICLDNADYNRIENNTIADNDHGIRLNYSRNNTVIYNMIVNNYELDTGAHTDVNSFSNELHNNCFIDNDPQAVDEERTGTNDWTGNFWSTYSGSGPYMFDYNQDNDPLDECPVGKTPEVVERVPALTPIGLIALVGLLAAIAAVTIVRKRR